MTSEERTTFCMRCRAVRTVRRDVPDWWYWGSDWSQPVLNWLGSLIEIVVLLWSIWIHQPDPWCCTVCGEVVPLGVRYRRRDSKASAVKGTMTGTRPSARENAR